MSLDAGLWESREFLAEQLGYLLFQRRDPTPLLSDDRGLLGDDRIFLRELGFELRDPIVSQSRSTANP